MAETKNFDYKHRDMDHLEDPTRAARRQGEPIIAYDDCGSWHVMTFGIVCSDGTVEIEAQVLVSREEMKSVQRHAR